MNLEVTEQKPDSAALKVFVCPDCARELRLMVWDSSSSFAREDNRA
jgi:hypothetical protein